MKNHGFFKEELKFLDDGIDIPFYNDIPKLSTLDWLIVLISVLLIIGYITVIPIPSDYFPIAFFLTATIPALYICKGNYSLFFKKVRFKDLSLIFYCVVGIFIYSIIMLLIIEFFTGPTVQHVDMSQAVTIMSLLAMVVQLFGEEFFKIFLLLLLMYIVYKFSHNRGLSLFIGLVGAMVIFGLVHYEAYEGRILQIILVQGFGSMFEYFAYLKTKNIWVAYLVHLIRDIIPDLMNLLNLF